MKSVLRSVKNVALSYDPVEVRVRDATSNAIEPAPRTLLKELARATYDTSDYTSMFPMIWQRLSDVQHARHVTKALLLVEYLLIHGSERFVADCKRRKNDLNALTQYKHYDEHNYDDSKEARMIAKRISGLLSDIHALNDARDNQIKSKRSPNQHSNRSRRDINENDDENDDDNDDDEKDIVNERTRRVHRVATSHDQPQQPRENRRVSDRDQSNNQTNNQSNKQSNKQASKPSNNYRDDLDIVSEEEMDEPQIPQKQRTNTRTTIRQSTQVYEPEPVQRRRPVQPADLTTNYERPPRSQPQRDLMDIPSTRSLKPQNDYLSQELDLMSLDDQPIKTNPVYLMDDMIMAPSSQTSSQSTNTASNSKTVQNRKVALLAELAALEQNDQIDDYVNHEQGGLRAPPVQSQSMRSSHRSKPLNDPLWSSSLVSMSPAASSERREPALNSGTSMAELRRARPLPSSAASSQLIDDFSRDREVVKRQSAQRRPANPNDVFF